jgi:hypothetical protein
VAGVAPAGIVPSPKPGDSVGPVPVAAQGSDREENLPPQIYWPPPEAGTTAIIVSLLLMNQ